MLERSIVTPELMVQLESVIPLLAARDAAFAADLVRGYNRYGALTQNQAPYVQRLIDKAAQGPAPAPETVCDYRALLALFPRGRFPKLYIEAQGDMPRVKLSLAGERSKYAGSIMVAEDGPFGESTWYGRIDGSGTFHPGRDATPAALLPALRALVNAPAPTTARGRENPTTDLLSLASRFR